MERCANCDEECTENEWKLNDGFDGYFCSEECALEYISYHLLTKYPVTKWGE